MAIVRRAAVLAVVAHASLNTGIDDTSVSLLQMRVERIHRPHSENVTNVSEEHVSANATTKSDGHNGPELIWSIAQNTIHQMASKAQKVLYRRQTVQAEEGAHHKQNAHMEHAAKKSATKNGASNFREKAEQAGAERGAAKAENLVASKPSAVVKDHMISEKQQKTNANSSEDHGDLAMDQSNHVMKDKIKERFVNNKHSAKAAAAELAYLRREVKALQEDEEFVSKELEVAGKEHAGEEHAGEEHAGEKHAGEKHAGVEHAGEEHAGEEHTGEEHTGEEHTGELGGKELAGKDEHAGKEHTGKEHSGKEHSGKEHSGEEHSGKEHSGEEHTGKEDGAKNQEASGAKEHKDSEHKAKAQVAKAHVATLATKDAAKEHAADDRAAKERDVAERAVAERAVDESANEESVAKKRVAEERVAKEHVAEQRVAEERVAEQRVAEERAAEERAAKERAAKERAAKERAAKERAAKERAAKERSAKRLLAKDFVAKDVTAKEVAAKEVAAEEVAAKEVAVNEAAAKEIAAKEVEDKEIEDKEISARKHAKEDMSKEAKTSNPEEQKDGGSHNSEPTLVRFTGNDLAKRAVHLDEMVSQKELGNRKQDDANTNEVTKLVEGNLKHTNAKFHVSSGHADWTESLERYHPGSKLYELEGGDEANKRRPETHDVRSHFNSSDLSEAKKYAKRPSMVSDAMEEAFGEVDPALANVTVGLHEIAPLHAISEKPSKSDSTGEHGDDRDDEFWGEEETSEIAREFTVEGIPMTNVLDKEQSALDRVDSQTVKGHSPSRMKTGTAHELLHKSTHGKTHIIEGSKKDSVGVDDTTNSMGHKRANKEMSEMKVSSASSNLSHADMCDMSTSLDFSATIVSHNNLGGQGPDTGDETLVYSGIANKEGFVVDLVISATSSYTPRDASKNGLQDSFGLVNLEINSAVDLLFRFVSEGQPIVMDSFYFTFFDLDQGMAHQAREKVTIRGFNSYELSEDSSLDVEELGESSAIFSSSMRGGKVDNPTSPLSLSHMQRERSVVVTFSGVSEFSVQLSEEDYASSQGRNWFFAGPSSLVCSREAKCSVYDCPSGYHVRTMGEFLMCAGSECTEDDRDTCCFEVPEEEDAEDESAEEGGAEDEDADEDEEDNEDVEDAEDAEDDDANAGESYDYDIESDLLSSEILHGAVDSKHHSEASGAEEPRRGRGMGMGKSARR